MKYYAFLLLLLFSSCLNTFDSVDENILERIELLELEVDSLQQSEVLIKKQLARTAEGYQSEDMILREEIEKINDRLYRIENKK